MLKYCQSKIVSQYSHINKVSKVSIVLLRNILCPDIIVWSVYDDNISVLQSGFGYTGLPGQLIARPQTTAPKKK